VIQPVAQLARASAIFHCFRRTSTSRIALVQADR
jgi:hypothetical protein